MQTRQTGWLAANVFAAKATEDLVFLKVDTDQYYCLAEAAAFTDLEGRRLHGPSGLMDALATAGLVRPDPPLDAGRALPPAATRSTGLGDGDRAGLRECLAFWMTERRARRLLRTPPLSHFLAFPGASRGDDPDPEAIARLTGAFSLWLPWAPRQGVCLYRAAFLLRLLRDAGQDATWVFGVRTWPFAAHCWLQVGDLVLDDTVERVRTFTPIMAV